MTIYGGFDVSDKTTHICVVDGDGGVIRHDVVATDPDVLAKWLKRHRPGIVRVALETGPLSTFLYHGLIERDVPVICICARHAKKALSALVNKSDVNDAESLAQLCRTGWFKAVHMKAGATHQGHITKAGDPMLCSALYEAANSILSRLKRSCALQSWSKKLAETKGHKRARIAVARKLAALLHRLWGTETVFCWN